LRKWGISTILPDGKIVVFGGVSDTNADSTKVLEPEIYDPGINWSTGTYSNPESWQSLAADPDGVARNYHSTNLLLPDGSLFTAGSSHNANSGDPATAGEMRIVLFKPDYFDNPARPDLNSTALSTSYGKEIRINMGDPFVLYIPFKRSNNLKHEVKYQTIKESKKFNKISLIINQSFAPNGTYRKMQRKRDKKD
jgi:hypothetical protein